MQVTLKFSLDEYLMHACVRVWEAAIRESSLPNEVVTLTKEDVIHMLDDDLSEYFQDILYEAVELELQQKTGNAHHWKSHAFKHLTRLEEIE